MLSGSRPSKLSIPDATPYDARVLIGNGGLVYDARTAVDAITRLQELGDLVAAPVMNEDFAKTH